MKEVYCSTVINGGNISCSCIVSSGGVIKRYLTVDDKGIIVFPSLDNDTIHLRQCIPPISSSLKVLGIFSIDDIVILSTGPDKNDRYHLLLYKYNIDNNNLILTLAHDLSIVYKPMDVIKYKDQGSLYVIVAGDNTLHVYELDALGRLSRSTNRSIIRALCERRIGLSSVIHTNTNTSNSFILRLVKNYDDNTADDIIAAAYSNGYICYDYIKSPMTPSVAVPRDSPLDWFHGESPRESIIDNDHTQGGALVGSRNVSLDSTYNEGNINHDGSINIDISDEVDVNHPVINQKLYLFDGAISCLCFYNISSSVNDSTAKNSCNLNNIDNLNASSHSYQSSSPEVMSPRSETWKSVIDLNSIANTNSFANTLSLGNQLSIGSIGSDNISVGSRYLVIGSAAGVAALLPLDDNSENSKPIPLPGAFDHGGVQAITLGNTTNGNHDIYVGYSDGTIIRASGIYNDTTNKIEDISAIKKIDFQETWRFKVPFPILSLGYDKFLGNHSDPATYQSNYLIVTTTKTVHIFCTSDNEKCQTINDIFTKFT